jgi:integrase
VGAFLKRWLEDCAKPKVRHRTYVSYEQLIRLHLIQGLGHLRLAKLGPDDVQHFLNRKRATGLSARSVQYLHAVLRHALGQALRWGLVGRNVASLVDPPRAQRPEVRPLSPEQARDLLKLLKSDRLEGLYSVALGVGLRQGEALGLHWSDVDLEAGTLTVRVTLQRIGKKIEFVEPKTARSRRTIALPAVAVAALRRHRSRQLKERLVAGTDWKEHGLVFASSIGTPLDSRNVTHRLQEMLDDAGLPRLRFHDLRHTAASLLLAQGVHPRVVMEILGHSQIKLTMDTYSHVIPALQREAADKMNAILRKM